MKKKKEYAKKISNTIVADEETVPETSSTNSYIYKAQVNIFKNLLFRNILQ